MVSEKQLAANSRNALKSTGPCTVEGKARSSKNATKHGLLSDQVLLSSNSKRQFNRFKRGIHLSLDPKGAMEELLVDRVIDSAWRMRRVMQVEKQVLEDTLDTERDLTTKIAWGVKVEQEFDVNLDYDWCVEDLPEELRDKADELLDQIPVRKVALAPLMLEKLEDDYQDLLFKIRRYESQFENSMYKALRQLERLQARRQGHPVLAPLAVDLNVTGVQPQNN